MSIPMPIPGLDPGPDYANNQNAGFLIVDSHNHTAGKGVPIPPAGLNISSNLTFQGNAATNLSYSSYAAGASATSSIQSISTAPASGINELFWTDSNGVATQITKNGVVNSTASSIPGESYGSGTFTWRQGSGSNTPANFDIGSITIRPNTALTTYGIQLSPPSSISSFYTITLPTIPTGATSLPLVMDNTGTMYASQIGGVQLTNYAVGTPQLQIGAVTNSILATQAVGQSNLALRTVDVATSGGIGDVVISNSCGSFSTSSYYVPVTNLSCTITTAGRPLQIFLHPSISGAGSFTTGNNMVMNVFIRIDGTVYFIITMGSTSYSGIQYPAGQAFIANVAAGTHTVDVYTSYTFGSGSYSISNIALVVYEI